MQPDPAPTRWAFCPQCRVAAEITSEWRCASTSGPVIHVRVACFVGHVYVLPLDMVLEMPDG